MSLKIDQIEIDVLVDIFLRFLWVNKILTDYGGFLKMEAVKKNAEHKLAKMRMKITPNHHLEKITEQKLNVESQWNDLPKETGKWSKQWHRRFKRELGWNKKQKELKMNTGRSLQKEWKATSIAPKNKYEDF